MSVDSFLAVTTAIITATTAAMPGAKLDPATISPGDIAIYDGIIPKQPPNRYAIIFIDDGTHRQVTWAGEPDDGVWRWQITSVHSPVDNVPPARDVASWVAVSIRSKLLAGIAAPGWKCDKVKHTFSQMAAKDETLMGRSAMVRIDHYSMRATSA